MSGLSTHVLDLTTGRPAAGVLVELFREGVLIHSVTTNSDGRCVDLQGEGAPLEPSSYHLTFAIGAYFARGDGDTFFDVATIAFRVPPGMSRCHVPLLASPFGYSTYRGS